VPGVAGRVVGTVAVPDVGLQVVGTVLGDDGRGRGRQQDGTDAAGQDCGRGGADGEGLDPAGAGESHGFLLETIRGAPRPGLNMAPVR
jgi:hypothetical protein